jgi:hypothetical protein
MTAVGKKYRRCATLTTKMSARVPWTRVLLKGKSEEELIKILDQLDGKEALFIVESRRPKKGTQKQRLISAILIQERFYRLGKSIRHSKLYKDALDKQ